MLIHFDYYNLYKKILRLNILSIKLSKHHQGSLSSGFFLYFREDVFQNTFDVETSKTTQINSLSNEYLFESNIQTNASYQTMSTSTNAHRNSTNNYNMDSNFLSFEELMDLSPASTDNITSKYKYKDESIYTVSDDKS